MAKKDEGSLYTVDYEKLLGILAAMKKFKKRFAFRVVVVTGMSMSLKFRMKWANIVTINFNK